MRIKSPWVDYYDRIQAYGQDDITYVRYPKMVHDMEIIPSNLPPKRFGVGGFKDKFLYKTVKIGFCGKTYVGRRFYTWKPYKYPDKAVPIYISKYLYTALDVEKLYDKMGWDKKHDTSWEYERSLLTQIQEQEAVEASTIQHEHPIFVKYHIPIFSCQRGETGNWEGKIYKKQWHVELNSRLQDFDFQRVFPPPLAFQEIRMYLSNLASAEKPIPYIDDVTMAEAKGFDKWSFRREPTKRK